MRVVLDSTLAFAALVAVVMPHTFYGTGLILFCSCLRSRVWVWFHTEVNAFYVSIRTTENYEFDQIRTAGATGNATNYKNSQGDNPICSTMDEISQPFRPFSPRAATDCRRLLCNNHMATNLMFISSYDIRGFAAPACDC